MTKIIKTDELKQKIVKLLLTGLSTREVSEYLKCDINVTNSVFQSVAYVKLAQEEIPKLLSSAGLRAVVNLSQICDNNTTSDSVKVRANEILLKEALNIQAMQQSSVAASNMRQEQLIERLNDLQKEAIKRTKPIDTGVIEHKLSLDDLMS